MAWAAGNFTRANGPTEWQDDYAAGITIEPGLHDAQDNDLATGINQCLNKDGSNAATGNLNLGGNRYTNSGAATARTDLAQVAQVQDGDYIWLGTTGGTATAQTASASPAITAYKAGQKFRMKIGSGLGSTGTVRTAHTININGVGAKNIKRVSGNNPTYGDWVAGAIMEIVYDGTDFIITNDPGGWINYSGTLTPSAGSASGVSSTWFHFKKQDGIVYLNTYTTWTQNTASAVWVTLTLPVRAFGHSQNLNGAITINGTISNAFGLIISPVSDELIRVWGYNQGNITTGAGQVVALNGFYYSE